jgi:hypothetical protein
MICDCDWYTTLQHMSQMTRHFRYVHSHFMTKKLWKEYKYQVIFSREFWYLVQYDIDEKWKY